MNNEIDFYAMTDYLANALDRDSDEEMASYIKDEFKIPSDLAAKVVKNYIQKFSTNPMIMNKDSVEFLDNFFSHYDRDL